MQCGRFRSPNTTYAYRPSQRQFAEQVDIRETWISFGKNLQRCLEPSKWSCYSTYDALRTQVTVTDLLHLFNNLSLAPTSWTWLHFIKTLELTIIIKQGRVCKDIFTWNMQLSCNRLLPNTYNRILLAITQFIFLQWPYQRVHIFLCPTIHKRYLHSFLRKQ